jgi:uroporphyrinogen-III synthase/uroporphyrinogen III methyltransferase/synthase
MSTGSAPRVAVTRDEQPGGALSLALRRHGLEPVPCPVLSHLAPQDPGALHRALERLEEYDWIVVTSARTVEVLVRTRAPRPLPERPRWAAVGAATAAALARHGIRAEIVPHEGGAGPLVAALEGANAWPGRKVLVPRAAQGRPETAAALRGFGAQVTEVAAYRTEPRPPEEIRAAWTASDPQGVVFASPSAVHALVDAVGAPAVAGVTAVVAIGATTAEALRRLGVASGVAPRADFDAAAELASRLLLPVTHGSRR